MSLSTTTTDRDEIRQWAEACGDNPAAVKATKDSDGGGETICFMFPGSAQANGDNLEAISWDEQFDQNGIALLHQNKTSGGGQSQSNKPVSR